MDAQTAQPAKLIPRRFRGRMSTFRAGAVLLLLVTISTYLAFAKELPWRQPFELHAAFKTSNVIGLNSPVRIAGVNVGKVTGFDHQDGTNIAVVTMAIDEEGLPIHKDATMKIRNRIFLEGNFFVDLQPGTPQEPTVENGDTIPVTQTSTPVQLDQILTMLQSNTREDLQDLLEGFGTGLTREPTAADDADQDPDVKGETAAQSLNDTLEHTPSALKNGTLVSQALLGTDPDDLSKLVKGLQKVTAALSKNEEQLKDLITNLNITFAAFASEESNLTAAIGLLGPTVENANSALRHLDEALPQLAGFARDITPGVRETPATIAATRPWIRQAQLLFSKAELGGLAGPLRGSTAHLAAFTNASVDFFRESELTSRCFSDVFIPSFNGVIQDGSATTGSANFKEFFQAVVGFGGAIQGFDANGRYLRASTGGGDVAIKTEELSGKRPSTRKQFFGNALLPPLGNRPVKPSERPPYKPDVACYTNELPDLNGPVAGPGSPDAIASSASKSSARGGRSK